MHKTFDWSAKEFNFFKKSKKYAGNAALLIEKWNVECLTCSILSDGTKATKQETLIYPKIRSESPQFTVSKFLFLKGSLPPIRENPVRSGNGSRIASFLELIYFSSMFYLINEIKFFTKSFKWKQYLYTLRFYNH